MGQKVHPACFRLGDKLVNTWNFFCYDGRFSAKNKLEMSMKIRKYIFDSFKFNVSNIVIKLSGTRLVIDITCKKPGLIIGASGAGIEKLKNSISKISGEKYEMSINVNEIKDPNIDANLISMSIANQLEKRGSFRKLMKKAVQFAMKSGAKGIKIACSGRLSGAEIARTEKSMEGTIPLHTLRAKIDYSLSEARTTYGIIGVKVWVHVPEGFTKKKRTVIKKPVLQVSKSDKIVEEKKIIS